MGIYKVFRWATELFYPLTCIYCGETPSWICSECIQRLPFSQNKECPKCRKLQKNSRLCRDCKDKSFIERLDYLFEYSNEIKKLIKLMKYKKYYSLRYELAQILDKWLAANKIDITDSLLVYPPSTKITLEERGFHQIQEICKCLQEINSNKIKILPLFKKAETTRQAELSKSDRELKIKDKISLLKSSVLLKKYKRIIILDDICTTGSTLNECCKVIKEIYPEIQIHCIAFARPKLFNLDQSQI